MKVVSVEEMVRIEEDSDAAGHSYAAMMEQAGRSVAEAILVRRRVSGKRVLILVGPGNNGGDGLVAARYLAEAGGQVTCYLLKPRDPAEDENFRKVQELDVTVQLVSEDDGLEALERAASETDVVVDALLGTGTRLPLRGTLADIVKRVKRTLAQRMEDGRRLLTALERVDVPAEARSWPFVVAVDGPTGLEYETGKLDDAAIQADITVTFAYPKPGHFRFPGAGAVGELIVADIGIDPALAEDVTLEVITEDMVHAWLPDRPPDAHKGTFGKGLAVAGSVNYTGAALLAAASATRAGAGLITLALPAPIHSAVAARASEVTYILLPDEIGVIAAEAVEVLTGWLDDYDALLVGPGLGREETTVEFVDALFGGAQGQKRRIGFAVEEGVESDEETFSLPPLIVDADGLNILSEMDDWPKRLPAETILTPHPGEMARLMDSSISDVQADRVEVAKEQAAEWGHVVVLKGAHTVVAAPDGRTAIAPFANPGLATAGTGDVLAGSILSMRTQGLEAFEAAVVGVYLHGLAGGLARDEVGAGGMVADDVLRKLPHALRQLIGQ